MKKVKPKPEPIKRNYQGGYFKCVVCYGVGNWGDGTNCQPCIWEKKRKLVVQILKHSGLKGTPQEFEDAVNGLVNLSF